MFGAGIDGSSDRIQFSVILPPICYNSFVKNSYQAKTTCVIQNLDLGSGTDLKLIQKAHACVFIPHLTRHPSLPPPSLLKLMP